MVPAGTIKSLEGSGFMFDLAEPELPLDGELAMFPPLLLSLDEGEEVEEELESAGAAGLLQPSRAKDK
jgi:hypothetical protein